MQMGRRTMCRSEWSYSSIGLSKHVHARLACGCPRQYARERNTILNVMADIETADCNSVFPAGVNVAATFDRGLAAARGAAMGAEHRDKGSDVQLGPVAGPLGRSPEGGRNWEGFR